MSITADLFLVAAVGAIANAVAVLAVVRPVLERLGARVERLERRVLGDEVRT